MPVRRLLAIPLLALLAACTTAGGQSLKPSQPTTTTSTSTTTTSSTTTSPTTTSTTSTTMVDPTGGGDAASGTPPAPAGGAESGNRLVTEEPWVPYATAGDVTLVHPSNRVEQIGYHESNHDGAVEQETLPTAVRPSTLGSRDRGTNSRGAADIVIDPSTEVRSPVTGTVFAANAYTLYCRYTDQLVFIYPDDHPGWEVHVLHVQGLEVAPGDHVVAGVTVIADHAHQLPFVSDVDELATAQPPWPHVHVEVDDPSVPDTPKPGDC